jgi:CRISPR-associated protein Csy1
VLNSQNAGRAYLLSSLPPKIEKRTVRLPKNDFFKQCLYRKNFQSSFVELYKFTQLDINNINIRTAIKNIIWYIIDGVLLEAFKIQSYYPESAWSNKEYYLDLPKYQKIWLDNLYKSHRENNGEWRDEVCAEISRWIIKSYESSVVKSHQLGDGELTVLKLWILEELNKNKEFF